jgi:uncharacterized phage protein (TIGR02216 family)
MAVGLGALRIPPDAFWRMTPRELERALAGAFGETGSAAAPTRETLQALMRRFPDRAPPGC